MTKTKYLPRPGDIVKRKTMQVEYGPINWINTELVDQLVVLCIEAGKEVGCFDGIILESYDLYYKKGKSNTFLKDWDWIKLA